MKLEDTDLQELGKISGVSEATVKKIFDSGIYKKAQISKMTLKQFQNMTGIGEKTGEKIIKEVLKDVIFESGYDVHEKKEKQKKLKIGSKNFDDLLNGGITPGLITEFFGPFGSAKTQFCHQLAVNVQLPEFNQKAIYIDTEGAFSTKRIMEMASAAGLDDKEALKNILTIKAETSEHLAKIIGALNKFVQEMNVGIVIVDSLIAHFRVDFRGRGELSERQQKLNKCLHDLKKLADIYDIPVIITNQVMASPGVLYGDPTRPLGGHVVGHASAYRIYLTRNKEGVRTVKLIDSPDLEEGITKVKITKDGIEDYEL
jgi:DNA repair protein RadA